MLFHMKYMPIKLYDNLSRHSPVNPLTAGVAYIRVFIFF